MEVAGDPLADHVINLCDLVDVEDGDAAEDPEGGLGLVEEDGLVYAFPEGGFVFVGVEEGDYYWDRLPFRRAGGDGELQLLQSEAENAFVVGCDVDLFDFLLSNVCKHELDL